MLICGIEEAGRGPVIGPLVMSGVVIEKEDEDKLKAIGVKDSKLLSPTQRRSLFKKIVKIAKAYEIIQIWPAEIDGREKLNLNLNQLEAVKTANLINLLKPDEAYIDCPSNNIELYRNFLKKYLKDKKIKLILEHKADVTYPVVSAASILAKVTRDAEIEKIKKEIGVDFGSGYPSDPKTQEFLKTSWNKYPELFRKSWISWQKFDKKVKQKKLGDF